MTVIVGLLAGSSVMIVNGLTAAKRRVEAQYAVAQEARVAVKLMAEALRNARRPADPRQAVIEGIDGWRGEGDLPADRVRFFAVDDAPVRADQPESDLRELEFGLLEGPEGELPTFVRRSDPTRNEGEDGGGVLDRLSTRVVGLNITYYDGVKWRDEWPTGSGWPTAVRLEVLVAGDDPAAKPERVTRLVNWPGWPLPGSGDGSEQGKDAGQQAPGQSGTPSGGTGATR